MEGLIEIIWECAYKLQLAATKNAEARESADREALASTQPETDAPLNLSSELAKQKVSRYLGIQGNRSAHLKVEPVLHQANEYSNIYKEDLGGRGTSGRKDSTAVHLKNSKKGPVEETKEIARVYAKEAPKAFSKSQRDKLPKPRPHNDEATNPTAPKPPQSFGQHARFADLNLNPPPKDRDHKSLINPQRSGVKSRPAGEQRQRDFTASPRDRISLPYTFTPQQLAAEALRTIRERNTAALGGSDNLSLTIVFLHRGLKRE